MCQCDKGTVLLTHDTDVNTRLIDQDSNEMNIIIGVEQRDFERAIEAIYRAFA